MLKEIGHILHKENNNQELGSLKYLGYQKNI